MKELHIAKYSTNDTNKTTGKFKAFRNETMIYRRYAILFLPQHLKNLATYNGTLPLIMLFLKSDCYRNHIQSEETQSQKYWKGNENINGKGLPFLLNYLTLKVVNEETNSH